MAEIACQPTRVLTITNPAPNLGPIDVIFLDHKPGSGRLIVRCYSQAWTAWWGAMGDHHTVRTFVLESPADYVAGALLYGPGDLQRARPRKLQSDYVERIVRAIQDALRAEAASPQAPSPQAVVGEASEALVLMVDYAIHHGWPYDAQKRIEGIREADKQRAALTPSPAPSAAPQEAQRTRAIRMAADALSHAYVRAQEVEDRVMYRSAGLLLDMLFATPQATEPASAAPHQGADALREALAWLVRLEDERIRLQNLHAMGHGTDYNHYHKTLPLAWATARAALAHHQAPQQGEPK